MSNNQFDVRVDLDVRILPCRVPLTGQEKIMWQVIENRLKRTLLSKKGTIEAELSQQASMEYLMEMQSYSIKPCCYMYSCEENAHYNFCPCCGKRIKK